MEIVKINKSQIYFTTSKECKKFKLKVSSKFEDVLNVLTKYDKNNLLKGLLTKSMKSKEFDIDFREMPTYETQTTLLNNQDFDINYTDDNLVEQILKALNNPKITNFGNTISCWYPERNPELYTLSRMDCISEEQVIPKYPIYVISLGRWEKRRTIRYLEKANIDYKVVVEPSEYDEYCKVINPANIIKCPEDFSKKMCGGIPVRNFVWEHSISNGHQKHWILDDNIECYYRNNKCQNSEIFSGAVFKTIEDYTDRYTNVKMSGHQYLSYAPEGKIRCPITLNTRIFSSILLSNDIYPEFKWRGVYNEDVDLSIRLQKAGYVNVLSNFLLCHKKTTMADKGGNTSTIYSNEDAHLKKAQALKEFHPDCVEVVPHKTRKWHHTVDFSDLKNELIMIDGLVLEDKVNDYGLKYVKQEGKKRTKHPLVPENPVPENEEEDTDTETPEVITTENPEPEPNEEEDEEVVLMRELEAERLEMEKKQNQRIRDIKAKKMRANIQTLRDAEHKIHNTRKEQIEAEITALKFKIATIELIQIEIDAGTHDDRLINSHTEEIGSRSSRR